MNCLLFQMLNLSTPLLPFTRYSAVSVCAQTYSLHNHLRAARGSLWGRQEVDKFLDTLICQTTGTQNETSATGIWTLAFLRIFINLFVSISDQSLRPSLTYQYQVFVNTAQAISVRIQYSNTGGCKPDGITALLCSHTKWSQLPTHSSMFVFILLKLKSKVISFQLRNMNNRLSGRFLYFISPLMVTHVKGNEWRRVVSRGE